MSRPSFHSTAAMFALIALGSLASVRAAEIGEVAIERDGDRFQVRMQARLAVPPAQAYAAFTRFEDLPAINPAVREARIVDRSEGVTRVETRLRVCIALFCPRFRMTQDMAGGVAGEVLTLSASMVPELSDFRFGRGTWTFAPCEAGTCLEFASELEPDFWIPPLIGTWMMRRTLRAQAVATSEGIERMARAAGAERSPP